MTNEMQSTEHFNAEEAEKGLAGKYEPVFGSAEDVLNIAMNCL